MKNKIQDKFASDLKFCTRVATILKEEFPNDVMKINENSIIVYSKMNSRLINKNKDRGGMSGCYAYFTRDTPHRVIIQQKTLLEKEILSTYGGKHSLTPVIGKQKVIYRFLKCKKCGTKFDDEIRYRDHPIRNILFGNWALIDLICHELAHHRTSGHKHGFKTKYHRFLNYMVNLVISGEFYQ